MKQEIRSEYIELVQQAIQYLLMKLDEPSDWNSVASQAFCSPFHFHHMFKALTGETALEMQRRCRLERAAFRLKYSDQTVGEVSLGAGFASHEAFTRAFKAEYKTSPQEWRSREVYEYRLMKGNGIHYEPEGTQVRFMLQDHGDKAMKVEVKEIEGIRLGALRHVGPYPQISATFGRLHGIAGPHGFANSSYIAIYYSSPDEVPEHELQSDACVVVPEDLSLPASVQEVRIPAGKYVVYRHVGNYAHLGEVWSKLLGEWLPSSGHVPSDAPCFEFYVNNCMEVGMDNAITDIYVGVR
jgi:AraC family transcriptional regulator